MRKLLFIFASLSILFVYACKKEETAASEPTLELRLTDGPGDYESVNIDVIGAEVHVNKDTGKTESWLPISIKPGVYDILKLSNGVDTLLGSVKLPLADIKEIRLKLGTNNTVKTNGQTFVLTIPSGGDSGLKLKFEKKIVAGISYKVTLDFDAAKSIKEESKGSNFKLRPVLRLITEANNGSIRGEIAPATCKSVVYAMRGVDTLTSAYPSSLGKFVLQGMDAGNYTVVVQSDACAVTKKIENVAVVVGKATELSKITLK
jgi:Domain of unknown function (DUF4382)